MMNGIEIRAERDGDARGIYAVHESSFPTDGESRLVDALRESGRLTVSIVAVEGEAVVGHVAFSPVRAANGAEGVGLGPVAVAESHRRRGIGAALIEAGIDACKGAGWGWCVVLGDPAYYARFGFTPASAQGLSDEYGGGDAFRVLELAPGAMPVDGELVRYAPEFGALG